MFYFIHSGGFFVSGAFNKKYFTDLTNDVGAFYFFNSYLAMAVDKTDDYRPEPEQPLYSLHLSWLYRPKIHPMLLLRINYQLPLVYPLETWRNSRRFTLPQSSSW